MPRDTGTAPDIKATINDPIYGVGTITAYTGTAGNTATLPGACNAVYVFCTTAAHIKVGVTAVATVADFPVPANLPVVLPVWASGSRVSAVQTTGGSGGNLHCMPLTQ